jgi:hypothetical protein
MNKTIYSTLLKLNITPDLSGFNYLSTMIIELKEFNGMKLYKEAAILNHTTTAIVERSIRVLVDRACKTPLYKRLFYTHNKVPALRFIKILQEYYKLGVLDEIYSEEA